MSHHVKIAGSSRVQLNETLGGMNAATGVHCERVVSEELQAATIGRDLAAQNDIACGGQQICVLMEVESVNFEVVLCAHLDRPSLCRLRVNSVDGEPLRFRCDVAHLSEPKAEVVGRLVELQRHLAAKVQRH